MTTEELNTMTIENLNALLVAVKARIEQLSPKGPCVPRNDFEEEVRADHYEFWILDDELHDDYDDDHYIEWLESEVKLSDEEQSTLDGDADDAEELEGDEKIEFLEAIYIKQNS
jgi:hypothetical protein